MAVGGVPPTVRLMAAVRALAPPAMAVSIQVPPAAPYCSANTFTAADSPPEVHQWITSAGGPSAFTWPAKVSRTASAIAAVGRWNMAILLRGVFRERIATARLT